MREQALRRFFGSDAEAPLSLLTRERLQALYDALVQEGLAAATHRFWAKWVAILLNWCVTRGWLKVSPAEGVRLQGKPRRGVAEIAAGLGNTPQIAQQHYIGEATDRSAQIAELESRLARLKDQGP